MVDHTTAFCSKCASDVGVESIHYDLIWMITVIKLDCGHIIKLNSQFRYMTKNEYAEAFPDE